MLILLIQQGRTLAPDINTAIEQIRAKHGEGRLSLRACPIQPVKGMTWYEFYIDKEEVMDSCMTCGIYSRCTTHLHSIIGCKSWVPVGSIASEKPKSFCAYCDKPVDQYDSIKVGDDRWHYACSDKALAEWIEFRDEKRYVLTEEDGEDE